MTTDDNKQVTGQGESGKVQAEQLLIMTSVLVPFLARLVMVNNMIIMMRRMKMVIWRRAMSFDLSYVRVFQMTMSH